MRYENTQKARFLTKRGTVLFVLTQMRNNVILLFWDEKCIGLTAAIVPSIQALYPEINSCTRYPISDRWLCCNHESVADYHGYWQLQERNLSSEKDSA